MLRLVHITTDGFMGEDLDLEIPPALAILGRNGAGKSSVLTAIRLLAGTVIPGVGATPEAIVRLARALAPMEITGTYIDEDGKRLALTRGWSVEEKRDAKSGETKTVVSTKVGGSLVGKGSKTELVAIARRRLGGWAETWEAEDLAGMSGNALRSRLLGLLGDATSAARWAADVPGWAKPIDGHEPAPDWIARVRGKAAERLSIAKSDLTKSSAEVDGATFVESRDVTATHQRLALLRSELGRAEERARADGGLVGRAAALERLRAQLDPEALTFAAALAARGAAQSDVAAARDRDANERQASSIRQQIAHLTAKLGAFVGAMVTDEEIAAAEARRDETDAVALGAALVVIGAAENRVSNTRGTWEAYAGAALPFEPCDDCAHKLRSAAAEALADHDTAKAALAEAHSRAHAALGASQSARADLMRLLAARRDEALAEERDHLEVQLGAIDLSGPDVREAARRALAANAALDRAQSQAIRVEEIERLDLELDLLRSEQSEAEPVRPAAEVLADIRAAERELEAIGAANRDAERRANLRAELEQARLEVSEAEGWVEHLRQLEAQILAAARERLERPASELLGRPVTLELVSMRGASTCRLLLDGVDVATLSDGERIQFLRGLLAALAPYSTAEWRPILVDRLESVDAGRRWAFVSGLADLQRRGVVSQVIACGCPDTPPPPIEGVSVITLGAPIAQGVAA